MPRRGGRERYRSAKQVPYEPTYPLGDAIGKVTQRARESVVYTPPSWLVKGAIVNYHSIIGQEVTKPDCIVTADPWNQPGSGWVTLIDKQRGWVACEALSRAR